MATGEAATALAAIDASRSWLSDRVIAPCWFHPAFGLLAGAVIAEAELRSVMLFAWSVVVYTIACGALMWWNQQRVGVAIQYFDWPTRAVYAAHVLALTGLIADQAALQSRTRAVNSAGSRLKAASGPPSARARVKCFSMIAAPSATAATAAAVPGV